MLKETLREKNYVQTIKQMNISVFNLLNSSFVILFFLFTFFAVSGIRGITIYNKMAQQAQNLNKDDHSLNLFFYIFVVFAEIMLYFLLIKIISSFFCKTKKKNIRLMMVSHINMPVCVCKEALKTRHLIFTYVTSGVFVYFSLLVLCLATGDMGILLMVFFFLVIISPDFSIALYIIYLQIKESPDYISVENHISGITLFKK